LLLLSSASPLTVTVVTEHGDCIRLLEVLVKVLVRVVIAQAIDVAVGLPIRALSRLDGPIGIVTLLGHVPVLIQARVAIRGVAQADDTRDALLFDTARVDTPVFGTHIVVCNCHHTDAVVALKSRDVNLLNKVIGDTVL